MDFELEMLPLITLNCHKNGMLKNHYTFSTIFVIRNTEENVLLI